MSVAGVIGKSIKGADQVKPRIKITEEVRSPFRELGMKPMARDDGRIDIFSQDGKHVGAYDDMDSALQDLKPGMKAYHGSPYKFSEFTLDHVGTGEGAQAYGFGAYSSRDPDVARRYRDKPDMQAINQINSDMRAIARELDDYPKDFSGAYTDPKAIELMDKYNNLMEQRSSAASFDPDIKVGDKPVGEVYADLEKSQDYEKLEIIEQIMIDGDVEGVISRQADFEAYSDESYQWFKSEVEPNFKRSGSLYEINIKGDESEFINWDKAVKDQSPKVREALRNAGIEDHVAGRSAYYKLAANATGKDAQKEASDAAAKLGIKGIIYEEPQAAPGIKNLVVFDPRLIEISKTYGVSIAVAAKMLAGGAVLGGAMTSQDASADDISSDYMDTRQNANLTPSQRLDMSEAKERKETSMGDMAKQAIALPGKVAADVAGGIIEAPRQALSGFLDATLNMAEFMESIIPLEGGEIPEESKWQIEDQPRTVTGSVVKGISQFMTGFVPAFKAFKRLGKGAVYAAGAFADAFGFDPKEERLSDLIQSVPELQNPVTEYLQSDPEDSDAEGRFKNALEGLGLGASFDGVIRAIGFYKQRRIAKQVAEEVDPTRPPEEVLAEQIETKEVGRPEPEQEFIPFKEQAQKSAPEFKVGSQKAGQERAENINLANIETTEDVTSLIDAVAQADNLAINEARREVITNQELGKLAGDLGMSVDDLLARRPGEAFNAEQILAARKILVASGENLVNLAKVAKTGGDNDMALFRRAMAQHKAIQSQVSGMTAEAGRALQSFNIVAKSAREQEQAIQEALGAGGGIDHLRDLADKLSTLDDPASIGKFIRDADKAKTKDMVYELWINSLLSSPATHVVNILSNSLVMGWTAAERKVAAHISQGLGSGEISHVEATSQLRGMLEGSKDGMRLAWKAFKTGEPTDPLQKIENKQYRSISSENLEMAGNTGRAVDFLGNWVVRMPGKMLTAGDEFFKSVGYRMELHAQAHRAALSEGLEGEAYGKRVAQILGNPPSNIHLEAVSAARYNTFTSELGPAGKAIENLRNKVPFARVIMPFVRTPVNIMKFAAERTPLAPIMANVRADISAGGARREMALARIATGSTIMALSADLAMSGQITGGGPKDPQLKNMMRATGWQPYSIKMDGQYYSYSRLDPVGAWLGLSADIVEIVGQAEDADALDIATASVVSVAQNVTSKTYLSGVSEFFDIMSSVSSDPEENNKRLNSWIARMAGTVIPSNIAQLERTMSPELSATYGILDKIQSRIPGWSDSLPPRRNIFGEPIVLSGGLGPDIMSPIYTSSDKKDKIADEIVRQKTDVRMPMRSIRGIELDAAQYDRYVTLYSGKDNQYVKMPLKDKLRETFNSSQYKNATDGADGLKSLMIKSVFAGYRDAAQRQMIEEFPQIMNDIKSTKLEEIQKLTGK